MTDGKTPPVMPYLQCDCRDDQRYIFGFVRTVCGFKRDIEFISKDGNDEYPSAMQHF